MSQTWGRTDAAGTWLHPKAVWTLATLGLALLSVVAIGAYQYTYVWTPLQRAYVTPYLRSQVLGGLGFTAAGHYQVLYVLDRTGSRLALDAEVQPVILATGETSFALTDVALHTGDRQLVWQDISYNHATLNALLGHWIYRDQTVMDLVMPAMWGGLGVFVGGLLIAIPADLARARERRQGRRLKGPELVTAGQFNGRHRPDGIGFAQKRWLRRTTWVRLPRAIESSHVLIMGDSGTGKSALIRQLLQQLAARGETAIVYDPALEYTPQFYTPERGDVILNPLDARCPYWSPGDEWQHEAERLTLATSLFPDRLHDNKPFFTEAPRRIFAHLLTPRPTPEQLAWWLCHDDELDRRVAGTSYATMIDRQAPAQRSGVLGSLNMVADTLKLLPAERDASRRWTAAEWAKTATGWLFLTGTPATRPRLVPLTSLWLDTLILRLMNQGQPGRRVTWFVLDELATLQQLPQLPTAITENRKFGNPLVLGFQGRSQLETRYGHDAEAMLSQPATKIFLRTSEADGATWIAKTIGDVEIERLRESRSTGGGGQQSYVLERQVEPLVMASEISGLAALRGYLKLGNLVVRLSGRLIHLPKKAPAFLERPYQPPRHIEPPASAIGTPGPDPGSTVTDGASADGHGPARTNEVHELTID